MIDNKGKLFGKISIVDIIIVLAFAVAVAGFAYKLTSGNTKVAVRADTPIAMELKMEQVRQYSVDAVRIGDKVYEEHGDLLGTIVASHVEQSRRPGDNGDGTVTYAPMENRYDLYIEIEAVGRVNDGTYYINGSKQFAKGGNVKIESPTMSCTGSITRLENK